ncbi:MAG: chalcone isomerase family protein [Kangiellaceae bacterium]|jgi:hypothetical protein|nr:chalcone isomerase family protein [Kangiellaceae bacterium]
MFKFSSKFLGILIVFLSLQVDSASNEEIFALQKNNVGTTELFLNGMGAVKKLSSNYYIAALYLPSKYTLDSDIIFLEEPKKMVLKFALDRVSARSFGRELAGSLKMNNLPEELTDYKTDLRRMIGYFKGIYTKGDTISFVYQPNDGITVFHNERNLGRISRPGFDKILFKAWLGEKPVSASFKKGLVGGNEDTEAVALLRNYIDIK